MSRILRCHGTGGLLIQGLGWPAIFWLNVSPGAPASSWVPDCCPHRRRGCRAAHLAGLVRGWRDNRPDLRACADRHPGQRPDAAAIVALAAGIALLAAFVLVSARFLRPLLDVRL